MATQSSQLSSDLSELSARLLAAQEVSPRARIIAAGLADRLPGITVNVYLLSADQDRQVWTCVATVGETGIPDDIVTDNAGALGLVAQHAKAFTLSGSALEREKYAHINVRRTLRSLGYIPLFCVERLVGTVEILSFDDEIGHAQMDAVQALAEIAGTALASAQRYEEERHNSLISITRLTQFYDVEKVFSSTLEMDELLPFIGTKIREVLDCQLVNVWLLQADESLLLMHQAGTDPTVSSGAVQRAGEGVPGDVSDTGEPVLISEQSDDRLLRRNQGLEDGKVMSLMVTPIIDKQALVGVIEVANKLDGSPFDDDDLFVLSSLTETASLALHNASLLLAERKVEVLETLVSVSNEITATLNLERMLQTIVDAPQAVIPYERAAIALEQGGKFRLSAVTGVTRLNVDAPDIAPLNEVLRWAMFSSEKLHVRQHGDIIDGDREETRAKFQKYFNETGVRGFYAMPLSDDTGRVGILALESSDPDFLSPAHLEILQVLAGQATVALRNAQMYKEVPFISVLEPMLEKKRKFMAMEKRRRMVLLALAAAAVLFLAVVPLPLRVEGDAVAAPVRKAQVQPEVEGVVSKVYVHEGQPVEPGEILADLEDWDYRSGLAEAEAKYETAIYHMNHALASNDSSEAGIQRVQADYWKAEVARARQLLERTRLRSPIAGVVATAHMESLVGRRLQHGDSFAEIVDTSQAVVDVAIDNVDAGLLKAGSRAAIKLNSYPSRTFRGNVLVVSPQGELVGDSRVFYARVAIPNADEIIRAGMEGRGKVRAGWYPAGYVFFRRPALWLFSHVWNWFGF